MLSDLLKSRTFWTVVLDVVLSILAHYFTGEDATFLIVTLQPLAVVLLVKFTVDDREQQLNYRAELEAEAERAWRIEAAKIKSQGE